MRNGLSRRGFLGTAAALALPEAEVPWVDYHAHPNPVFTVEDIVALSKRTGIRYGVVEHAGKKEHRYPGLLSTDADLKRHIDRLEGKPVLKGIQAEWVDWMECFSKDLVARLDYVLTDALTMPDKEGRPQRIFAPGYAVQDQQEWMERYVAFHLRVISKEPIDILANPTYLPEAIAADYQTLWTPERMTRIIRAALDNNVALEIDSLLKVPKLPFLKLARRMGARFSFGSNTRGKEVGDITYGLEMAKELGLKRKDMFEPAPYGKKPIQIRKLS
jgi:histidinol phosphatase-like PHP family hydrolase